MTPNDVHGKGTYEEGTVVIKEEMFNVVLGLQFYVTLLMNWCRCT